MKKVINKYFCDHCGKEVEAVDRNNPLNIIDLRIDDACRNGYFLYADLQLCNDCNEKLRKDIDYVVSLFRNHWVKEEKKNKKDDDELI